VHAKQRFPVPEPLGDDPRPPVEGDEIGQVPLGAVHLGVFQEVPLARDVVSPVEARDDVERRDRPAPVVHDPDGLLGGHPAVLLVPPGDREAASLGLPEDVVGSAVPPRAPAAKAPHPLIDDPGVDLGVLPVPDPPPVKGARPVVLGEDVGLGGQTLHDLDRFRLVEIERHEVFVRIGAEETQARSLVRHPAGEGIEERLVERGGVTHRLAPLGQLDLDRLGAQLREVVRAGGAENVLGRGNCPDPFQDLGLFVPLLRVEDGLAEIFERHILKVFCDCCSH
jgi:hypothetical protein